MLHTILFYSYLNIKYDFEMKNEILEFTNNKIIVFYYK